ncbi:MAG TPA: CCA tRNA nucleotidyltransferase [Acidobacteriota bacterium]|nr:CCA tRNA nucleotidyltransferase [Acidobacteriota bacterium]
MPDLRRLDPGLREGALSIVRRFRRHGHQALLAGGVVRDLLLGRKVEDVDIAVSATPEQIEALFPDTYDVGRQFGVILVRVDGISYEVTTFRMEGDYLDGRHPSSVSFSDARHDARRRDFTVNALFYDPFQHKVIDYVGGQEDLRLGVLRSVGRPERRFQEDKLRILRAIRFACRLGFDIEKETWRQVEAQAPHLTQVSWERIRDELIKMLTGPDASRGLLLMQQSGIMQVILPEVAAMEGVAQPPQFHPEGDVFTHTRLLFKMAGQVEDPALALAMLLHDVGKPPTYTVRERIRFDRHAEVGAEMAEEVARRLRLSNETRRQVVEMVRQHLRFMHVEKMRRSTLKRFLRLDLFDKHLTLHRWDCLASHGDLGTWEFCRRKLEEFAREPVRPQPLLDGNDLIEMGYRPGPLFKEILTRVEDLQLEGQLSEPSQARQWVTEHYAVS